MTAPNNKPVPLEVLRRFKEYHMQKPSWGSLHVVLEDKDVSECQIKGCIDWAITRGDPEGAQLGHLLLTMSKSQRLKLPRQVDAL